MYKRQVLDSVNHVFYRAMTKNLGNVEYSEAVSYTHLGNPVVIAEKYRKELMGLTGDKGGKRVVKRHMDDLYLICLLYTSRCV